MLLGIDLRAWVKTGQSSDSVCLFWVLTCLAAALMDLHCWVQIYTLTQETCSHKRASTENRLWLTLLRPVFVLVQTLAHWRYQPC